LSNEFASTKIPMPSPIINRTMIKSWSFLLLPRTGAASR
jgi:hypothetical protein